MAFKYETLPGGHTEENAKRALKKAVKNGFREEDVLTQSDGSFLIPTEEVEPDEALSASEAVVGGFPGEDNSNLAPDESKDDSAADTEDEDKGDGLDDLTVADLDQFAADNNIEVKSGLNKPDKVAFIRAALAEKE